MKTDRYVLDKIDHMRRLGLVGTKPDCNGVGANGGAAPDWLVSRQRGKEDA